MLLSLKSASKKWEETDINISSEEFFRLRAISEAKWEEYKAKHADWWLGNVPRTITASFVEGEPAVERLNAVEQLLLVYALYQTVKVDNKVIRAVPME